MTYTPVKGTWNANAAESVPDLSALQSVGFPSSGDPRKGAQPTKVGAAWFYLMDQMRLSVISAAALETTVPPDAGQFLEALQSWKWALDGKMPGKVLEAATIATSLLANNAVTATKIANAAVETAKIKDAAVIKNATIAFAKLASAAIATSAQAADKSNAATLITPARLHEVVNSYLMPAGTIVSYAGNSIPNGWLLCNGATVSRTTYANLFKAIGTLWGAGNGSTTFALPDSDGRVLQGTTDGTKVGKYLEAGLPNITGTFSTAYFDYRQVFAATGVFSETVPGSSDGLREGNDEKNRGITFTASKGNSIYQGTTVQPPAIQTLIIIKV